MEELITLKQINESNRRIIYRSKHCARNEQGECLYHPEDTVEVTWDDYHKGYWAGKDEGYQKGYVEGYDKGQRDGYYAGQRKQKP